MPRTSSMTKYGRPGVRRAGVQHLGDVGMVHHRQRLPLGLEAGDDALGVHAQLDDLERHAAADRLLLLGHINHAAAAFADLLQQFVAANPVAGFLSRLQHQANSSLGGRRRGGGTLEKRPCFFAGPEKIFDAPSQSGVPGTSLRKKGVALTHRKTASSAEDGQLWVGVGAIRHRQMSYSNCQCAKRA